jgi:hypothetical protein
MLFPILPLYISNIFLFINSKTLLKTKCLHFFLRLSSENLLCFCLLFILLSSELFNIELFLLSTFALLFILFFVKSSLISVDNFFELLSISFIFGTFGSFLFVWIIWNIFLDVVEKFLVDLLLLFFDSFKSFKFGSFWKYIELIIFVGGVSLFSFWLKLVKFREK